MYPYMNLLKTLNVSYEKHSPVSASSPPVWGFSF
jgi:hypothetical protein